MANRVLLGKREVGGQGLFVSMPTKNVVNAPYEELEFSTSMEENITGFLGGQAFKVIAQGVLSRTSSNSAHEGPSYLDDRAAYFLKQKDINGNIRPCIAIVSTKKVGESYEEQGWMWYTSGSGTPFGGDWETFHDGFNASGGTGTTHGRITIRTHANRDVFYTILSTVATG